MQGDDVIVFLLLLGLIAFVSLIISGLIFITEPLFQNNDIILKNPNLGISKMALIMSWLSLPVTLFMTAKIVMKIAQNPISIGIISLGLLLLLAFILYGLSILSMGLFQQDGVYINTLKPELPQPTPTPTKKLPRKPTVYTDTLTKNCMKLATIFSWLTISWNIFFFIKATSS
jgi:hypothetical protein